MGALPELGVDCFYQATIAEYYFQAMEVSQCTMADTGRCQEHTVSPHTLWERQVLPIPAGLGENTTYIRIRVK